MSPATRLDGGKECTEARHELILGVLRFHSPATPAQVTRLLNTQIEAGSIEWPQGPWSGARADPYDGGTRQMLDSMVRKGWVEKDVGLSRPTAYKPSRGTMRNGAQEALALKGEGLNGKQIAERMGISTSLAYGLINDPFGEKEKERKKRYCPGCGAKKKPGAPACPNCRTKAAEELLPPASFLVVSSDYKRRTGADVIFGVSAGLERVIRIGTARGIVEHVLHRDMTWDDAVAEWLAEELA